MRSILIAAALLAAGIAHADDDQFLTGEALQKAVAAECSAGCVVLTREDAAKLQMTIQLIAQRAYLAGMAEGKATCTRRDV